jgi:gamma-glutamylcyclotransferase (GGCT)/AIG2-like uncharacterized protein YtfP
MGHLTELVFVYGTLRGGGSNHFRLDDAELLGPAVVNGRLYRIDWYPGLVLDPSAETVLGEVYCIRREQLAKLDAFEGISPGTMLGAEYRRVWVTARLVSGEEVSAWVWEWLAAVNESRRILGGDWLDLD